MARIFIILSFALIFSAPLAHAKTATAMLEPTEKNSTVIAHVDFEEVPEGLKVYVAVAGTAPGFHGIHIHETGSCAKKGKAAGGHFNLDGTKPGNMGNVEVQPDGTGILALVMPNLNLSEGKHNITGKSVILYEKEDNFGQPTGNAGARIACGIIKLYDPTA